MKEMLKVCIEDVWVTYDLTEEYKVVQISRCTSLKRRFSGNPFFKQIIRGGKKRILNENRK